MSIVGQSNRPRVTFEILVQIVLGLFREKIGVLNNLIKIYNHTELPMMK